MEKYTGVENPIQQKPESTVSEFDREAPIENEPIVPEQSAESTDHDPIEKEEVEKARLDRISEIRGERGMKSENLEAKDESGGKNTEKNERIEKQDFEEVSNSVKRLSGNIKELSGIISRNKFPKVRFDSEQLVKSVSGDKITEGEISRELQSLALSVGRIKMPDDSRDRMQLEPHNIRSVMDGMRVVSEDLSKLKGAFERSKSGDYSKLADEVKRIRGRIDSKTGDLHDAVSALQRYKGR